MQILGLYKYSSQYYCQASCRLHSHNKPNCPYALVIKLN